MVQADEVHQPELRHRIVAAAGASIVAALLVNPLDVIKTRVQAGSIVTDRPLPTCLLSRTSSRYTVRWARPSSLSECQAVKLPANLAEGCIGAGGLPGGGSGLAAASHLPRRLLMGQLPMSSCACALKVMDLGPERFAASPLPLPERCRNTARLYQPITASGVLRDIVRKEGPMALWRGTDTAMLASIPMVGIYMPLYDYLLQRTAVPLGGYAPPLAGSAARTLAVLMVGPLELVRTRQQGSVGGARTAWAALRETLRHVAGSAAGAGDRGAAAPPAEPAAAASSGPGSGLGSGLRLLRSAPLLWRGVGATLARDVPFSAIYWGLMERTRGELLARWQHSDAHPASQAPTAASSYYAGSTGAAGGAPSPRQQQQQRPMGPSSHIVLAANLAAGSASGAVAALVTTPFDVVKTQLQVGSSSSSSGGSRVSEGILEVCRRILREEGVGGLFRGWAPRAARTAPACAVVVASYEVLKMQL